MDRELRQTAHVLDEALVALGDTGVCCVRGGPAPLRALAAVRWHRTIFYK